MDYKQCVLKKGDIQTTTWIPDKYAKIGKPLQIKDKGKWSDGWIVQSVGSVPQDEETVKERSQYYKKTRKFSDI